MFHSKPNFSLTQHNMNLWKSACYKGLPKPPQKLVRGVDGSVAHYNS